MIRKDKRTQEKRNAKGITLIALVVTIVVLLILAGVTINAILGDNGIIAQARRAADAAKEAAKNDEENINELLDELNSILSGDGEGASEPVTPIAVTELKFGDYVYYTLKDGTEELCQVIYTKDENGPVEIMPVNVLGSITLGYDDPISQGVAGVNSDYERAKYSWEHSLDTLTNGARGYENEKFSPSSSTRVFGSYRSELTRADGPRYDYTERKYRDWGDRVPQYTGKTRMHERRLLVGCKVLGF